MSRDPAIYAQDILQAADKTLQYVGDMDFDAFSQDSKTCDAVIRNLEIIGEAVKQIPKPVKDAYQDIDWRNIARMRDILIHAYFGVSLKIVWDAAKLKIPDLRAAAVSILQNP